MFLARNNIVEIIAQSTIFCFQSDIINKLTTNTVFASKTGFTNIVLCKIYLSMNSYSSSWAYFAEQAMLVSRLVLFYEMANKKSCAGLSLHSQILGFLSNILHVLYGNRWKDVYEMCFHMSNVISSIIIISLILLKYRSTYDKKHDKFNSVFAIIASLIIAYFATPKITKKTYLYSFSLCIETFAILPQLVLLQRSSRGSVVSKFYVFCIGCSKILLLVDIIVTFDKRSISFYNITVAIQALLYSDFVYEYINSIVHGMEYALPL